jgi:ABC-type phosphate transport system auxiliary subunit
MGHPNGSGNTLDRRRKGKAHGGPIWMKANVEIGEHIERYIQKKIQKCTSLVGGFFSFKGR